MRGKSEANGIQSKLCSVRFACLQYKNVKYAYGSNVYGTRYVQTKIRSKNSVVADGAEKRPTEWTERRRTRSGERSEVEGGRSGAEIKRSGKGAVQKQSGAETEHCGNGAEARSAVTEPLDPLLIL